MEAGSVHCCCQSSHEVLRYAVPVSRLSPISTFVAGEALSNNHYADLHSAKFSHRAFEFDIGWMYITLLSFIGLSEVQYAREGAHVRVSESTHG